MNAYLDRETSQAIFEAIGHVKTEKIWLWSKKKSTRCSGKNHPKSEHPQVFVLIHETDLKNPELNVPELVTEKKVVPAFSFAEILQEVLPLLMKRKYDNGALTAKERLAALNSTIKLLATHYAKAPSAKEGMALVGETLRAEDLL